jgi:hypothetical protein
MINSKAIPAEDVLDAVDMPDTKAYSDLALAPRRIIQKNIADILKNGKGISPEPFDDHKLALRLVNQAYHKARLSNVPEPKLELLRRYMADSADLAGVPDPSVPPPPAPPMGPPGMAPPMGGPPPPMAPPMGPPPMGQAA